MKKLAAICLVLNTIAFANSPPVGGWNLKGFMLYFIDWSKPGIPYQKKFDILSTPPQKIVLFGAPHEIRWDNFGNPESTATDYQMGLSILYEENRTKERKRRTIWISKNCHVEAFAGDKAKKDSVILAIFSGSPKEIQRRIFTSKSCKEILNQTKRASQ